MHCWSWNIQGPCFRCSTNSVVIFRLSQTINVLYYSVCWLYSDIFFIDVRSFNRLRCFRLLFGWFVFWLFCCAYRSQRETSVASVAETSSSATTTTTSSSGRIEIVKTVDSSVTLQDFEWTNESIAKGAFGQTWKVVLIETDEQFALKTYNKKLLSKRTGNQQPSVAEQERIIFSKLSNPFISKLHWAFEDNKVSCCLETARFFVIIYFVV